VRGGERVETATVAVTRQVIAGSAMVVVAGFAAGVLFPTAEPVGRVLVMALATGVLAALVTDWRACLGVLVTSMLVFGGVLVPGFGGNAGGPAPWSYTPLLVFATMLGFGFRRIIGPGTAADPQSSNGPPHEIGREQ
jgi:hypothetical protein